MQKTLTPGYFNRLSSSLRRGSCGTYLTIASIAALFAFGVEPARAAPEPKENAAEHEQLRSLRDRLIAAVNTKNTDAVVTEMQLNVVLLMQDGKELRTVRGHDGLRDYLSRMLTGPSHGIDSVAIKPIADDLSILYHGDSAIAFGSSLDHYRLIDGSEFELKTRWTATVVKEDGRWLLAALHVSTNMFDNPVVDGISRIAVWVASGASVLALILGFVLGRLTGRTKSKLAT